MKTALKVLAGLLVILLALLVVNMFVLDSATKSAAVTAPDGEILELSSVDLQVVDRPADDPAAAGRPIVLLHCFGCSTRWWDGVEPLLAEDHRIVEIDLIGHGGSEKPNSGYEIDEQASSVAEALNRLGVQRATVVGHSMGGMVAASLATKSADVVDQVALIGTPPEAGMSDLGAESGIVSTPLIGQGLWRVRTDGVIRSGYESAFAPGFDMAEGFEDPDQPVADNRAMTYRSFTESQDGADEFLAEQSITSRLTAVGVPVLAILGAEDQIFDAADAAERYAGIPGAQVETIEGSGHSPNVEDPEATAALIEDFSADGAPTPPRGTPGG